VFLKKNPLKIQILDSQSQYKIVAFQSMLYCAHGYKWCGRGMVMYEIFFGEILGDNFVSGLRTLKPKSVKLENFF